MVLVILPCMGFQVALVVRKPPAKAGDIRDVSSISGLEDPLEEGILVFLPVYSYGQRGLAGYSP